MKLPKQIHCSHLPRVLICPSSLIPPKTELISDSEPAALGRLVHDELRRMVEGEEQSDDLEDRVAAMRLPIKDVRILLAMGRRAWSELFRHFPEPRAEFPVESELLIGTADVAHHDTATAAVADWKTGWAEYEHAAQVTGYAFCLRSMFGMPKSGKIMAAPVHLRTDTMDVLQLDDRALDHFELRVQQAIAKAGKGYAPGEACTFCPRAHECGARAEWLRSAVTWLRDLPVPIDPQAVTPESVAKAYPTVQAIAKMCEAYKDAVRSVIDTHGAQPVDETRELKLIESQEDVIDPLKLRDVVVERYGWTKDDLYRAFKVTKKRVTDAIRATAPRGEKKAAEERLLKQLEDCGGLTKVTKRSLRVVKK